MVILKIFKYKSKITFWKYIKWFSFKKNYWLVKIPFTKFILEYTKKTRELIPCFFLYFIFLLF
jgi:hypothetical protein